MFSYSGLARMASRVAASGAWLRTSSSHDCLVSSIAAHSSPRGSTPAFANRAPSTCVSTLPKRSRPRALASRRAGSTVITSTLPPRWAAAMAAAAAAVVVLPTPPDPQQITISLAARSGSSDVATSPIRVPGRLLPRGATLEPQLRAERLGDLAGGAHAVAALEQLGHVEQVGARRQPRAEGTQVLRPRAPQLHGELGSLEQGPHGTVDRLGEVRGVLRLTEGPEDALLAVGEQLRQHPVDHHGRQVDNR